jgi:hypothetical protein
MLSVIMLNVTHKPFILSVIMLSVVMLSVTMLSVVMPSVVAPKVQHNKTFLSLGQERLVI